MTYITSWTTLWYYCRRVGLWINTKEKSLSPYTYDFDEKFDHQMSVAAGHPAMLMGKPGERGFGVSNPASLGGYVWQPWVFLTSTTYYLRTIKNVLSTDSDALSVLANAKIPAVHLADIAVEPYFWASTDPEWAKWNIVRCFMNSWSPSQERAFFTCT